MVCAERRFIVYFADTFRGRYSNRNAYVTIEKGSFNEQIGFLFSIKDENEGSNWEMLE
jgi:hypothetical protein